jgi:hypothetical protein
MLPQRPTRRNIQKPAHVPELDFTRLAEHPEDDEQDEEEGDYEVMDTEVAAVATMTAAQLRGDYEDESQFEDEGEEEEDDREGCPEGRPAPMEGDGSWKTYGNFS